MRMAVCGLIATARLAELAWSSRNLRQRRAANREGSWTRRTYPLMVLLHATVIAGTAIRGSARPASRWIALLLAAAAMRAWVLLLLGDRWNTRAAVPAAMPVETRGPYGFIRHPNYAVVIVELFALPMAFHLPGFALLAGIANCAVLALRIPEEEAALMQLPGYAEHFGARARFIPGII